MRNAPQPYQPAMMLIGSVVRNFRTTAEDSSVVAGATVSILEMVDSVAVKKTRKKKDA